MGPNKNRRSPIVLFVAMGVSLVACAAAPERVDVVASFAASYPDATPEQSECVADRLIDRYGISGLEQKLSTSELEPEFGEAQFRDMFSCGMDGDVREQLEGQLIETGVGSEEAPCVAEALAKDVTDEDLDVLLSGEISDEFYGKFFEAMDGCDAVNGE